MKKNKKAQIKRISIILLIFLILLTLLTYTLADSVVGSDSCGTLSTENEIYNLTTNVTSTGTCFTITANNVTLDGNGYTINYSSDGTLGYGVYVNGANFTTVRNAVIKEGRSATSDKYAIYFYKASNGTIINNNITTSGTSGYGVRLYLNSNSNTLSTNSITTSGGYGYGVFLNSNSNSNTLSNNSITTSGVYGSGVFLSSSSTNNLTGNKVNSSQSNSYVIYGTSLSSFNNTIGLDNLAEGKPVNYTFNADNLVFNGVDFTQYGEVIFGWSRNITITNSNFSDDSLNLFYTNTSTITNNNINTSKGWGVYLFVNSNSNTLSTNSITTSGGSGYGVYLLSSSTNTLSNNSITTSGSSGFGVYLSSSSTNTLSNNSITTSGSSGFGVYLESSSNSNTISNNSITTSGTSGYGVRLYLSSNSNTLSSNSITTSGGYGYGVLLYLSSNSNSFSGMNVRTNASNGYAIYLYDKNHNFTISDSILNSSFPGVPEVYIRGAVNGGIFNFTNITRSNGSPINISWNATANGTLNLMWYLDVHVNDSLGVLSNANVSINDLNNNILFNELSDVNGVIERKILLEYLINRSGKTYYTPHIINITKTSYNNYYNSSVNMSDNLILYTLLNENVLPSFSNLRNFTLEANNSFSQSITASDASGIGIYFLNNTNFFNISRSSGLIINITNLSRVEIHYLNISVNDTLGNLNSGIFYINITEIAIISPSLPTGGGRNLNVYYYNLSIICKDVYDFILSHLDDNLSIVYSTSELNKLATNVTNHLKITINSSTIKSYVNNFDLCFNYSLTENNTLNKILNFTTEENVLQKTDKIMSTVKYWLLERSLFIYLSIIVLLILFFIIKINFNFIKKKFNLIRSERIIK